MKLSEQIKQNSLALISLFVALSALGYNTWRNESSEANRNTRQAGFESLLHIGELQKITYLAHFDKKNIKETPRVAWTEVLILKDLSRLMPTVVQSKADTLTVAWENNWQGLTDESDISLAEIDGALHELRMEVLVTMSRLE